jgi:hypothetical protein
MMAAERAAGGMRRDNRHAGRLDDVAKRVVRDVRDVDDHAEVVHGADDVASEVGESAMARRVARGVAPVVRVDVRERQVARPRVVQLAQRVERVFDRVAAFDADQ